MKGSNYKTGLGRLKGYFAKYINDQKCALDGRLIDADYLHIKWFFIVYTVLAESN